MILYSRTLPKQSRLWNSDLIEHRSAAQKHDFSIRELLPKQSRLWNFDLIEHRFSSTEA